MNLEGRYGIHHSCPSKIAPKYNKQTNFSYHYFYNLGFGQGGDHYFYSIRDGKCSAYVELTFFFLFNKK